MNNLKYYQDIIKEKRKNTSFRDYLKEIASLRTMNLYNNMGFISVYPPNIDRLGEIISHKEFNESRNGLSENFLVYDFGVNFFENFKKLYKSSKLPPTVLHGECENAIFTDQTVDCKDSYLSFVVIRGCENVLYSFSVKENSVNVFNSIVVWDTCENIFSSKGIIKSFNIFYSKHIINSSNIWFSSNLVGCHDCIFCDNLDNQSYRINNKSYSKEEYLLEKEKILRNKNDFSLWYSKIDSRGNNFSSKSVNGIFNIECENIVNGANNYQIKNGKNIMFIGGKGPGENIYDCFLNTPPETDVYGVFSTGYCDNIYNSYQVTGGSNIYYSVIMENCSFCLGCIGLKNKSYCILNKQYTKEEWEILSDKIFSQMETEGILGSFFPGSLNPYYFNDSAAYLIDDSFTKEEVEKEGYIWREDEIKVDIPEGAEVVLTHPQPIPSKEGGSTKSIQDYQGYDSNGNWQINPEILKKVIKDEKGNIYRIVQMEYDFLVKHGLPLPEIHWLDRIKMGFKFK